METCNKALQSPNITPTLSNFTCNSDIESTKTCMNNVTIINGMIFIDNCDSIYAKMNIIDDGNVILTKFKPTFNLDDTIHYILDLSNDLERNRISLFIENRYLKLRVYNNDGTEITIKYKLEVWENENFYDFKIQFYKPTGHLFLRINNKVVASTVFNQIDLDLINSKLYLGSDVNGENQAEGYFKYSMIGIYHYPEPIYSFGAEESAPFS